MRIRTESIRRQSDRLAWMFSTITAAGQGQRNGIPRFVSSAIDISGAESMGTTHDRFYSYKLTNVPPAFLGVLIVQKKKGIIIREF